MDTSLMNRNQQSRMGEYQESKALSEIKGKMYLARQFPRDPDWSLQNVLRECERPELAESAQYEFPKGESVVKGPSIRLVEVLARHWGNIDSGVNEIEANDGSTMIKAYAWDLEYYTTAVELYRTVQASGMYDPQMDELNRIAANNWQ